MSELPFTDDDSDEPELPNRGRALWAFAALASAAVIIVALMVFLLGDPGSSPKNDPDRLAIPAGTSHSDGAVTAPTQTVRTSTSPSTRTPSTAASSSPSTTHAAPRSSCPSSAPCVSPGDPGEVVAAINAYRTRHGASTLPGSVSAHTQQCALHAGEPSACPSNYSWEPVEQADGTQVVEKIVRRGGGTDWLLDANAKKITVGWAYVPTGQDSGHYSCAVTIVD